MPQLYCIYGFCICMTCSTSYSHFWLTLDPRNVMYVCMYDKWRNMIDLFFKISWLRVLTEETFKYSWKELFHLHLTFKIYIVTCRLISRKQTGQHLSAEMRFLDTSHRWVLNKRSLLCESEICRLLERSLLWNQQTCPWIRAGNKHFPRIPLRYISGRSDKNEVIHSSFVNQKGVIRKLTGSRKVTLNQVSHSRRKTRKEDSRIPVRTEWLLGSHLLWALVIDCD
jgi:hypothetical protein